MGLLTCSRKKSTLTSTSNEQVNTFLCFWDLFWMHCRIFEVSFSYRPYSRDNNRHGSTKNNSNKSERPVDALAVKKITHWLTDNLKSRDASASENWRNRNPNIGHHGVAKVFQRRHEIMLQCFFAFLEKHSNEFHSIGFQQRLDYGLWKKYKSTVAPAAAVWAGN